MSSKYFAAVKVGIIDKNNVYGLAGFICSTISLLVIIAVCGWYLGSMSAGIDNENVKSDMQSGNDSAAFAVAFVFIYLLMAGLSVYTLVSAIIALVIGFISILITSKQGAATKIVDSVPVMAGRSMIALDLKLAFMLGGWIMSPWSAMVNPPLLGLIFIGAVFVWIAVVKLLSSLIGGWLGTNWDLNRT